MVQTATQGFYSGDENAKRESKGYQKPQLQPWQLTLRQFQSSLSDQPVPEASAIIGDNAEARSASWERAQAQYAPHPMSSCYLPI